MIKNRNSYLILILLFAVFVKLLTFQMLGADGDSSSAWNAAKNIAINLNYFPGHISSRMGKIIPAVISINLFGTHPIVYFIAPITFFFISLITVFKITRWITGSDIASFWSAFLFMIFPNIIVFSTQLKPSIFSITYILLSIWFLIRHGDSRKDRFLYLSSFFIFFAYLSKATNLFFLPGLLIIIFLNNRSLKEIIKFSFIPLLLFAIETLFYRYNYNFELGRLSVILKSHLSGNERLQPVDGILSLFKRYTSLRTYWYPFIFLFLSSIVLYLLKIKNTRIKYILFPGLSFLFLITFAVKSISPLTPALPFLERYLNVIIPVIVIMISVLFHYILNGRINLKILTGLKGHIIIVLLFAIISTAAYPPIYMNFYPKNLKGTFIENYPLTEVFKYFELLNSSYKKGIPIITPKLVQDRFNRPYQRVNKLMAEGLPFKKALEKAKVKPDYYKYCEKRVKDGDYKAWQSFRYFFLDFRETRPVMHKVKYKSHDVGVILKKEFYDDTDSGALKYLGNSKKIIMMKTKPFRVREHLNEGVAFLQ